MTGFSAVKVAVAAVALVAVSACTQGQPRVFKIALDRTQSGQVARAGCWANNNVPQPFPLTSVNLLDDAQWLIWEGEGTEAYLDVGTFAVQLADSAPLVLSDLVKGDISSRVFSAGRTQTCAGNFAGGSGTPRCMGEAEAFATVQWSANFAFDTLGAIASGTVTVSSVYACAGNRCRTGMNGTQQAPYTSCEGVSLPFKGRKIEAQNLLAYQPAGTTPAP